MLRHKESNKKYIYNDKTVLDVKKDFEEAQSTWTGKQVKQLSVSAGYVTKREFPDMTVVEMAKIADERMYEDKNNYYIKYPERKSRM